MKEIASGHSTGILVIACFVSNPSHRNLAVFHTHDADPGPSLIRTKTSYQLQNISSLDHTRVQSMARYYELCEEQGLIQTSSGKKWVLLFYRIKRESHRHVIIIKGYPLQCSDATVSLRRFGFFYDTPILTTQCCHQLWLYIRSTPTPPTLAEFRNSRGRT